jgi:hypothetical protein
MIKSIFMQQIMHSFRNPDGYAYTDAITLLDLNK